MRYTKFFRTKALIFIILALLLGLWAMPVYAQIPPIPHAFYGNVTINGDAAPVGTIVTAEVNGVQCLTCSYTVKVAGQYGDTSESDYLTVQGSHSGDTVEFFVNGVKDTSKTAEFLAGGGPTPINLSVTITIPPAAVSTSAATSVSTTSAALNGNLSSLGTASSVTVSFQWGTSASYGDETAAQTKTSTGSFSASLSNLDPATTYHFRAKVVGDTTSYGSNGSFTTPDTPPTSGGGGGVTPTTGKISSQGILTQAITAASQDGLCSVTIAQGRKALDKNGSPLSQITVTKAATPPAPPANTNVIGHSYDFGPDGATFAPSIPIEFNYSQNNIPGDVDEKVLSIAYYDKSTANWVELDSTVDTANNIITALVSHFTDFAVLGHKVIASSTPAAFTISSLSVSPKEVKIGETVTISIMVENTGGQLANYRVTLKVGGEVVTIKEVGVAAGASKQVSFNTTKDKLGTYPVDVNGLTGSFAVKETTQAVAPSPQLPSTQTPPPAAAPSKPQTPSAPPPPATITTSASQNYRMAYYDGSDAKRLTRDRTASATGNFSSHRTFVAGTDVGGTWNVIVCSTSYTPPSTYSASWENTIASHSFTVQSSAIPEFPTILAAIISISLCAGIYLWMRRKAIAIS
ncbi:CARDB domain-containing protein [Chloroflexota bacterium]